MTQHLFAQDYNLNELQNALLQKLATDPASPADFQFWGNTASGVFKVRMGGVTYAFGRLDQLNAPAASLNMNNQRVINQADPTAAQDSATKAYVDALLQGFAWKDDVRAASTANVAVASPGAAIDGITPAAGDRVLLKNQTAGSENGIWVFNGAAVAMSRAADADSSGDVQAMTAFVNEGTANADTAWTMTTNAPITLGSTALAFVKAYGGATSSFNKFAASVGDGTATSINVTHNLGTRDLLSDVWRNASPWDRVFPKVQLPDANTATVLFSAAPAAAAYRLVLGG